MKSGTTFSRRFIPLAVAGILVVVLAACTGRGGGYLPPDNAVFKGQASFGFTFSCEDKGGVNPPTGQLRIQLAYAEHGTYGDPLGTYGDPLPVGAPFSIHGIVDVIDPVLESAVCIGQNPPFPPPENQLTFLGRYRLTSGAAPASLGACPTKETRTSPLCRFEVTVRDNDRNLAPSSGDFFSIKLSNVVTTPCNSYPPDPTCSQLPSGSVFYTRAGLLAGGNLTVR